MARLLILYLGSLTLRSFMLAALAGLTTFRMRSVARSHAVWTAVVGFMLLMPVADALLPASLVPLRAPQIVLPVQTFVSMSPAVAIQPHVSVVALAPAPSLPSRDWWQIAVFVWIGVAAAFLFRLALAGAAIVRIKRTGQSVLREATALPEFAFRAATIRESREVTIPLTLGLWRPVLMLPLNWRDWDDWKLRAVLAHELTHVRRRDWAIGVTASLVRSVFWFNPLSWWLERNLSSLAEQASDEACVHVTGDAPRYAETLLQFASVAKHGRRWIGGVAMAQYKISSRIERVLRLQKAGSGVLSRAGWIAVCLLAVPVLYVSAAAQSLTRTEMPTLSPAEILRVVQRQLPVQQPTAIEATPAPQQPLPVAPVPPAPQVPTPAADPVPAPQGPFGNALPVNPDLIGEIKLILAPVDQAPGTPGGQVQIQTRQGNSFGTAIWNVRNSALNRNTWTNPLRWNTKDNDFTFALTGVQGRTVLFEAPPGTFAYGCPNCSFVVSETGVSAATSGNTAAGVIFRLSTDGKSIATTCRAAECQQGTASISSTGVVESVSIDQTLKDGETKEITIPQQPAVNPGLVCFSVFGNVKADGTPFSPADCPISAVRSVRIFSFTK